MPQQSSEVELVKALQLVQKASLNKQVTHISQKFSEDPHGSLGIVAVFVVCEDQDVAALQAKLDETVRDFLTTRYQSLPIRRGIKSPSAS